MIGIAGTGQMARGICVLAALSGMDVTVWGRSETSLGQFRLSVARSLRQRQEKGKIDEAAYQASVRRICATENTSELQDATFVIETVAEDLCIKRAAFESIEAVCKTDTVIASNTSSLLIRDIAALTIHPERIIGLHFMNPPGAVTLVEVVSTPRTSDWAVQRAVAFCRELGREPLVVKDQPGFVLNRVLFPLLGEAVRLVEEGGADADTVDRTLRRGANHPMGPLELADLIGLDVCAAVFTNLSQELHDSRYDPPELLLSMVAEGKLGRKSGAGFYAYDAEGKPAIPSSCIAKKDLEVTG
jgi:3-hydroxybutyryl-CoA dehydrogenase